VLVKLSVFVQPPHGPEIDAVAFDGAGSILLRNIGENFFFRIEQHGKIQAGRYEIKFAIIHHRATGQGRAAAKLIQLTRLDFLFTGHINHFLKIRAVKIDC
jgi:hypothetical protein